MSNVTGPVRNQLPTQPLMKALKISALVAAGLLVALIGVGAAAADDDRPAAISKDHWIKLSGHAGLALAADAATASGPVSTQLYVKLDKGGWKLAKLAQ
jgi:hypothetical protein